MAAVKTAGRRALERAMQITAGARRRDYGHPLINHERIARLWTARLHEKLAPGAEISPEDVTSLMRLAKEARLIQTPGHTDSLVDIAGYAAIELDIHDERGTISDA